MGQRTIWVSLTACALATACGGKGDDTKKAKDDAATRPTVAPIAIPTIGVDSIRRMNYQWNYETIREYGKALVACCTKGKPRDWAGTRTHAEAVLAKDPQNIGAHWLLGVALSQTGDHAAAVDHLVTAIAADFTRYGANLAKDDDLAPFLQTSHGTAVTELTAKIREDFKKRASAGMLVVGRRADFRWPEKPGVASSTSRGELFAYDRDTRRYLRLTQTNESIAGFIRAPSGSEIAVLGFERIDRQKDDTTPPIVTRAFVFTLDTTDWKPSPRAVIDAPVRELSLGYGAGDQLLVGVAAPSGRWTTAAPVVSSIDRTTGKLAQLATPLPADRIAFSLEEGRVFRVPDKAKGQWTGDPLASSMLEVGGKPMAIPESGAVAQSTVAVGTTYVAFATAVDPCSDKTVPSLYVLEQKTGTVKKHLLSAKSRFHTRWLSDALLAYEDGDGAIRVWDASTGRESFKLENKSGLALDVLSLSPAPLCKQAPPAVDVGSGSADELPPEEGPVTAPH